ncbi:hypothetical protein [Streptomyces spinosisporus]|uniref:Uncharacterized protein n=1 Tax=Streptomyces spinosisporus TaxID=2927582 RepID=A0ABS9XDX7_9ACTN|nr:hypothetical protein [Streptomyces spinosisporus]MCI3240239.1 hypothetical protein [Streptomyces spinosisporus]
MRHKRPTDHFAIAARCRANSGEWQEVGEYNSMQSADSTATTIRKAYVGPGRKAESPWAPAGAYEARREHTEFGVRVEARYVGDPDEAWADALSAVTGGEAE